MTIDMIGVTALLWGSIVAFFSAVASAVRRTRKASEELRHLADEAAAVTANTDRTADCFDLDGLREARIEPPPATAV